MYTNICFFSGDILILLESESLETWRSPAAEMHPPPSAESSLRSPQTGTDQD